MECDKGGLGGATDRIDANRLTVHSKFTASPSSPSGPGAVAAAFPRLFFRPPNSFFHGGGFSLASLNLRRWDCDPGECRLFSRIMHQIANKKQGGDPCEQPTSTEVHIPFLVLKSPTEKKKETGFCCNTRSGSRRGGEREREREGERERSM